jgi:hypothetical protein
MTGFLDRLAGFATRSPVAGTARVALPSRFAPAVPSADHPETARAGIAAIPAEQKRPVRAAQSAAHEFAPRRVLEESPRSPLETARVDVSPARGESRSEPTEPQRTAMTPKPAAARVLARARDQAVARQESAARVDTGAATQNPLRIEAPAPAIPVREPAQANAAPLSADAVSHRPQPANNAPPPVYVTIDRIDVRVTPVPKTTPPARARRAPGQTLSEYLRGPERGGRS